MNPAILAAWRARLAMGRAGLGRAWKRSALRVSGMGLLAFVLALGTYKIFRAAFAFVHRLDVLGPILLIRLLSVFFFMLFVMLFMSNVLVTFQTLYRSREADFWILAPLPPRTVFSIRSLEIALMSSWAFLVLGLPLLLAYGRGTQADLAFFLLLPPVLLTFAAISHFLGTLVTLSLVRLFPGIDLKRLFVLLVAVATPLFLTVIRAFRIGGVERDPDGTELVAKALEGLARTQFPAQPGYWAAEALRSAAHGDGSRAAFLCWALFITALFMGLLAHEAAARFLVPSFQLLRGKGLSQSISRRTRRKRRSPAGSPWRALALKDVTLFLREPSQWSQVLLVSVLAAVYISNLRNLPDISRFALWGSVAGWLNLGVTLLLVATLTTRFAFPLISMEGRRAWVVFLAPLPRTALVMQKFALAFPLVLFFGVSSASFSAHVLGAAAELRTASLIVVGAAAFALTGQAVGLGALFPDFREDNPARIVSGFGGTLNFLLGMAYILLSVGLLGAPSVLHALGRIDETTRTSLEPQLMGLVLLMSALVGSISLLLGWRNLSRLEL